ncbi:MAG: NAD(P)/FAD-dependent oxidoreductase [Firmicutes bacterium]|nr:NAD(P)/FAD-dependent oxidoreductase [Bacillota bacterium]
MYDVIIIGAGIIGTFIGRELSKYRLKIALLDKENDIANGTTKANTAIIHAGYDAKEGSNMAKYNVKGNKMFDRVCEELGIDFKRIGSLVLAFNDEDINTLNELYNRGIKNGVTGLEILDRKQTLDLEPNINGDVKVALYAPTCGIIDPWNLAIALAENAIENGMDLFLRTKVHNILRKNDVYTIYAGEKTFEGKYIINCSGLYADKISAMVENPKYELSPRRGQYFILDKKEGKLFNSVIFQCPSKMGKGVVVTPTIHGNVIIGPNAEDIDDREGYETTYLGLNEVKEKANMTSRKINFNETIKLFSGIRAEPSTGDFIIKESENTRGFINVAGIKSPGLSSAPAIAEEVVKIVNKLEGGLKSNLNFNPNRKKIINFEKLSDHQKNEIIKSNFKYGNIVCRCENVTEGEIVDCINRNAGATTVDGVKKRVRPGSGRCQGGFCLSKVMEILARELNCEIDEVLKNNKGSYILTGRTTKGDNYEDL